MYVLTGDFSGGGEGSRTPDTGIFSPLLYQLSYPAIWCRDYYTKLPMGVKDFFPGSPVMVRAQPHTSTDSP